MALDVKFYFNSTMVRLKELLNANADIADIFQFHYGTIKRWERANPSTFNVDISIPLWYD